MVYELTDSISDPPGPAKLDYEPKKVVKKGSVKLTCSVEDAGRPPSNTFRWVRGSHLIQDVTSSNWTIDPVTLETKANFTCSAYNLGGEGGSSSVFIDVHGRIVLLDLFGSNFCSLQRRLRL